MSLLEWKEEYSVGIEELDEQHKHMFGLINKLYDAMRESRQGAYLDELLKELADYGKLHTETEESYFTKYDYPHKDTHIQAHDAYKKHVDDFIEKESNSVLSMEILDFLQDWWIGHITGTDQDYATYFKEKGVI